VRDHSGQALAYIYFEEEPGRRSAAKLLSKDGARGGSQRGRQPRRPRKVWSTNGDGLAVFDLIRHKRHGDAAVQERPDCPQQ
jgi:hypothetical protein